MIDQLVFEQTLDFVKRRSRPPPWKHPCGSRIAAWPHSIGPFEGQRWVGGRSLPKNASMLRFAMVCSHHNDSYCRRCRSTVSWPANLAPAAKAELAAMAQKDRLATIHCMRGQREYSLWDAKGS
jgi:hypothetical protein